MPDDKRVNLDSSEDLNIVKNNLLQDVAEATKLVRERKQQDKAADARLRTESRDRRLMYVIIAVAAVAIILVSYWMTFGRGSAPPGITDQRQSPVVRPPQTAPAQGYQTRPQYVPPRPAPPPSEPMRRTPTDTYDEGPDAGSGM